MNLPTGTVTFLFTDIEGSSRLWEQHPQAMRLAMARHDELLKRLVRENRGHVVKMRGDGLHAVFASVQDAVQTAVDGQRALAAENWDEDLGQMPVRMGIHSGVAQLRDGDYFGTTVNRAARLQDAGHGGQILLSQVSAALLDDQLPSGISLLDLGRQQIKDFPSPERIYQVLAPDLRDRFPPLRTAGWLKTNLPVQTTSFVGREREIRNGKQMLEQARLVTISGPGGTGKTRLALKVSEELAENYRDGVWMVELAQLTAGNMVLPAVANVFALQSDQVRSLETVLADFLRDKNMLLLLDNCEHLIEACADLASSFLSEAASLRILASSREPLGVPGEIVLRVPSLSVTSNDNPTAAELRKSEAAQLFSERARAVRRDFQLVDENAHAVAEICRRLDGIPLAIELAASRLRLFSTRQLADRLNDRFRLLTGGSRMALPRQQTLQALIDWSYELLTEDEQGLFRRLSVFTGGWTFEAAEAVGGGLDVIELLDQLVKKSLVQTERTETGTRFGYLETIRQYARERLFAFGEGEEARALHFAYFYKLAVIEAKNMYGPREKEIRLILRPEIENFHQALEWSFGRDPLAALNMLVSVTSFLIEDGGWGQENASVTRADVQAWLEAVGEFLESSSVADGEDVRRAWTQIHLLRGQTAIGIGDFDIARRESGKAIMMARELGDKPMLLAALGFYATTANVQEEFDEAAYAAAEECVALARELDSPFYKSMGLNALASYELNQGNIETAQAFLAEAAQGGDFMSAMAAYIAGMALLSSQNDSTKALTYLEQSRNLFRSAENSFFLAVVTSGIAHARRRNGEWEAAEAYYHESLAAFYWHGHSAAVAHELECLAFIARKKNQPERALSMLGAADALRERTGFSMLAHEKAEFDAELTALKEQVNGETFQAAWMSGRVMGIEEAVSVALDKS